jgi:hypothetical protein
MSAMNEMAVLCLGSEKPETYEDLNNLLWQAFELGKQYEKENTGRAWADLPDIPELKPVNNKCAEVKGLSPT